MKRPLLLVALSALALGMLLTSGCSKLFRSHKAWQTAQQESPLEIPPGLDRPSTSEALVIPPPGSGQPAAEERHALAMAANGEVSDGFVLKDTVDSTYQRVGRVLEHGDLGQVVGHDDQAHSYTLNAAGLVAQKKPGLFKRLFHWRKRHAQEESTAASTQVVVTITANGSDGSEVRAQGSTATVGQVVEGLKSRLGG